MSKTIKCPKYRYELAEYLAKNFNEELKELKELNELLEKLGLIMKPFTLKISKKD